MEVHIELTTGEKRVVEVGERETVGELRGRVAVLLAVKGTSEVHLHLQDGVRTLLGEDSTPIRGTALCDGDSLWAEVTARNVNAEAQWPHPQYAVGGKHLAVSPCGRYAVSTYLLFTGIYLTDLGTAENTLVIPECAQALAVSSEYIAYTEPTHASQVHLLGRHHGLHPRVHTLRCGVVNTISLTSDGLHVVVGCETGLYVFSAVSGECLDRMDGVNVRATVSRCNRWVATHTGVYEITGLNCVCAFGCGRPNGDVVFSPGSGYVALADSISFYVFATDSGERVFRKMIQPSSAPLIFLALSPCATYLFSGSQDGVRRWDLATGQPTLLLRPEETKQIYTYALSEDMQTVLVGYRSTLNTYPLCPVPENDDFGLADLEVVAGDTPPPRPPRKVKKRGCCSCC